VCPEDAITCVGASPENTRSLWGNRLEARRITNNLETFSQHLAALITQRSLGLIAPHGELLGPWATECVMELAVH